MASPKHIGERPESLAAVDVGELSDDSSSCYSSRDDSKERAADDDLDVTAELTTPSDEEPAAQALAVDAAQAVSHGPESIKPRQNSFDFVLETFRAFEREAGAATEYVVPAEQSTTTAISSMICPPRPVSGLRHSAPRPVGNVDLAAEEIELDLYPNATGEDGVAHPPSMKGETAQRDTVLGSVARWFTSMRRTVWGA